MCVSVYSVLDKEYMDTLSWISPVVEEHKSTLVAGIPQLNMCDVAVMVRFTQNHFFSFNIFSMFFCKYFAPVYQPCRNGVCFWPAACKAGQHCFPPSVVFITLSQFNPVYTLTFLYHFYSLYHHWASYKHHGHSY